MLVAFVVGVIIGSPGRPGNQAPVVTNGGPSKTTPQPQTGQVAPADAGPGFPAGAAPKFAPNSIWTAPVPADAPLDPSSAARTRPFIASVEQRMAIGHNPTMNTKKFSTPIYVVGPNVPRVKVSLVPHGKWADSFRAALQSGVPVPQGALGSAGTDKHITIYQPSSDSLWEFWRFQHLSDGYHAAWGGALRNVSNNPGFYTTSSWPPASDEKGWQWGATASSLVSAPGLILPGELRAGVINHAIGASIGQACKQVFSWPAQRHDGKDLSPNCMPEGAHLRLDPKLDLNKLHLPWMTLVLARAAQRYGIIVHDTTNDTVAFAAEDMTWTGRDPYRGPHGLFRGEKPHVFMSAFPWSHLQLLPLKLCTSSPCAAPAGTKYATG